MLDAVRISGRWVCRQLLDRLTARSLVEHPPTRRQLVEVFCRGADWRDRKGQLCLSSANVALNRLERRGLVRLPPPARRSPRKQPRRLWDDGKPTPPLPRLPSSVEAIADLRLYLLRGADDPHHGTWNRLIGREHPLKRAPLFGSQLRYLIVCGPEGQEAFVGAFGFGPASYHLGCRDQWIGWDSTARKAHLPRVIGLSRFLIRPGLRCANLASRSYGLVLSRVAGDWKERYGIRPVLVETFVDRSTHTGRSLSAANWRRLGESRGRGRSSPSAQDRPKSVKDVWVYELESRSRVRLQQRPPLQVTPRSVFLGFQSTCPWVEQELDGLDLGSVRLERRFAGMLGARWRKPGPCFKSSFDRVGGKAAYRFLENPHAEIGFERLLSPHHRQTQRRMAAESVVVLAQDTTTLSYNTLRQTRGLGAIGERAKPGRGLLLHTLQAFRLDGIPLGCTWARVWARPRQSDTHLRNEQSVDAKESGRWIEAYQAAAGVARSMPRTHLVVCGDRESDIFELYDQSEVAPPNLHLLVRAQHDRGVGSGARLWESLSSQPSGATFRVTVPRRLGAPARTATLELKWCPIEITPPRVALKKSWRAIRLHAVMAREIDPPAGHDPIEWVLLTDWKVDSAKTARRMVQWYGLRWGIECWHQVLKSCCGIETRQMKNASGLERALALDMIIAWRARLLCRLSKQEPNLPASLQYTAEELEVLEAYRDQLPRWVREPQPSRPAEADKVEEGAAPPHLEAPREPSPDPPEVAPSGPTLPQRAGNELTILQANVLVAMFAGFWGRKGDGHPGPRLMTEGLAALNHLVIYRRILKAQTASDTPKPRQPNRKPG